MGQVKKQKTVEEVQEELLQEREKFSLFLSLNTNCFFEYSPEDETIVFAKNDVLKRLSGFAAAVSEENMCRRAGLFKEDYPAFYALLQGKQDGECELRFVSEKNELIWCIAKAAVLSGSKPPSVIGAVILNDENHKNKEQRRIQEQQDSLTGVYNSGYFYHQLEKYLEDQGKDGKHTLLLVDFNGFKKLNETYGRLFCDTVLADIGETLKKYTGEQVMIGRCNGARFAILLKNREGMREIRSFLDEVNKEICRVYAGGCEPGNLSFCVGAARFPFDGKNSEHLYKKAMAGLYQAKVKGNNALVFGSECGEEVPEIEQWQEIGSKPPLIFKGQEDKYLFGQEIINYAFELLSTTRDIHSAIVLLLRQMGKEYGASAVRILGRIYNTEKLKISHEWCSEEEYSMKGEIIPYKMYHEETRHFNEENIYIRESREVTGLDQRIQSFIAKYNICANMQYGIYEEGQLEGIISVETGTPHAWSDREKDSFAYIARLITYYLLRFRVTEKIQEQVEHAKKYDGLTGVPTMYKFKLDADELLNKNRGRYALIYMDIGNFRSVNEMYGYQGGDQILYDLARAIRQFLAEGSIYGRVSADKFVILMPCAQEDVLMEEILCFSDQFHNYEREKYVAANLVLVSGVAFLEEGDRDISRAIDNANTARKYMKGTSNAACKFYDTQMDMRIKKEREITNQMEDAINNREFVVFLQPKVALEDERVAGAEALVRWCKPDGSMVSPGDFIPLFEENGFVVRLDFYVFEEVLKLLRKWLQEGESAVPISVNVSRIHLEDENFVEDIIDMVEQYEIPPKLLELELTESAFVSDTAKAVTVMRRLRQYGFQVSIDDFGAGYSSLTLLKDMQTDVIKLDKEFFGNGRMKEEEQIIVKSIVNMAKQLNMKVLSEGIETESQNRFLKGISCDLVQGYFYAKPMEIERFEEILKNNDKKYLQKI